MLPTNYFLFLQIILFLFITPGTPRIVIISYSMNYGVQKCIWTALGDISANFIQATLVIFVIVGIFCGRVSNISDGAQCDGNATFWRFWLPWSKVVLKPFAIPSCRFACHALSYHQRRLFLPAFFLERFSDGSLRVRAAWCGIWSQCGDWVRSRGKT